MDNWWIDETPYPGPAYEASFSELITRLRLLITSTDFFTAEAVASVKSLNEEFRQLMFPGMPRTQKELRKTEKELRVHALEYVQNRNTGPQEKLDFNPKRKR